MAVLTDFVKSHGVMTSINKHLNLIQKGKNIFFLVLSPMKPKKQNVYQFSDYIIKLHAPLYLKMV